MSEFPGVGPSPRSRVQPTALDTVDPPADSTASLVVRAQGGDDGARDMLFARSLPALARWARGRLPDSARGVLDTVDIVQDAAVATLRNLKRFESQHPGAFMAYLREAVDSKIKDQLRRTRRRPPAESLDEQQPDAGVSPLERAIGREQIERYETALARLTDLDRAAVVSRIELHQSYEEIRLALGKPTANAARVAVVRALERLVREMDYEG
jgi:RNA polymerase sigma factor (sigma-70 family)